LFYFLQFDALQLFTLTARVPPFLAQVPAGQYPELMPVFARRD
jgi:hypothetical protein